MVESKPGKSEPDCSGCPKHWLQGEARLIAVGAKALISISGGPGCSVQPSWLEEGRVQGASPLCSTYSNLPRRQRKLRLPSEREDILSSPPFVFPTCTHTCTHPTHKRQHLAQRLFHSPTQIPSPFPRGLSPNLSQTKELIQADIALLYELSKDIIITLQKKKNLTQRMAL